MWRILIQGKFYEVEAPDPQRAKWIAVDRFITETGSTLPRTFLFNTARQAKLDDKRVKYTPALRRLEEDVS